MYRNSNMNLSRRRDNYEVESMSQEDVLNRSLGLLSKNFLFVDEIPQEEVFGL